MRYPKYPAILQWDMNKHEVPTVLHAMEEAIYRRHDTIRQTEPFATPIHRSDTPECIRYVRDEHNHRSGQWQQMRLYTRIQLTPAGRAHILYNTQPSVHHARGLCGLLSEQTSLEQVLWYGVKPPEVVTQPDEGRDMLVTLL